MKKKITVTTSLLLVAVTLCLLLSGCGGNTPNTMEFSSEEQMKAILKGTWNGSHDTVLVIDNDTFTQYSCNETLIREYCENNNTVLLNGTTGKITFNHKKGVFTMQYDDGSPSTKVYVSAEDYFSYDSSTNLGSLTYSFNKENSSTVTPPGILYSKVVEYKKGKEAEEEKEKQAAQLESKKNSCVSYTDFIYNPYEYLGSNTYVEGTAELDTYYNWGFRDLEAVCFCIKILPTGGSYSDTLYIYAQRSDFGDLFTELQGGTKKVCLFINPWYYEGYKHNMGWLTDYYVL